MFDHLKSRRAPLEAIVSVLTGSDPTGRRLCFERNSQCAGYDAGELIRAPPVLAEVSLLESVSKGREALP
jgi:hypothetical protein